jgi:hypothetical protein
VSAQTVWNIETAIKAKVAATASLTSIIGTHPVRIYPELREDNGSLPAIVYELNSSAPYLVLSGVPTLTRSSVSLHCLALDKKVSVDIAQKAQAIFADWSQDFSSGGVVKISVKSSRVSTIQTDYQPPADGATHGLYLATLEVVSMHS